MEILDLHRLHLTCVKNASDARSLYNGLRDDWENMRLLGYTRELRGILFRNESWFWYAYLGTHNDIEDELGLTSEKESLIRVCVNSTDRIIYFCHKVTIKQQKMISEMLLPFTYEALIGNLGD